MTTPPDDPQATPPAGDEPTPVPDAAVEETGPPRCCECDAVLDPDQTYYLECGAPTPLAPRLRRRTGMAPLAAGLAMLGVGAGFLGFAVAADDGDGPRPATVLTAPPVNTTPSTIDTTGIGTGPLPPDTTATVTTPPTDPGTSTGFVTTTSGITTPPPTTPFPGTDTSDTGTTGTLPSDTTGLVPDETETEDTTEVPPAQEDLTSDWPVGRSAWTAIVASAEDADAARQQRTRARRAGYGAGILLSDEHTGLAPGLYVVYVGVYRDRTAAVAMAARARSSFPGAYARFIS